MKLFKENALALVGLLFAAACLTFGTISAHASGPQKQCSGSCSYLEESGTCGTSGTGCYCSTSKGTGGGSDCTVGSN